jgi:Spy/CpxP family protein refolding chaperone
MNWNRKTKTLAIAVTVMLVAAAAAFAQARHRYMAAHESFLGPGFEHHMIGFFADYLDLTDAQQTQAKQILDKERPTVQPLIAQLAQTHQKMRVLEEAGTFDEAAVRTLAAQQAQTMTELIVQKARIKSELMAALRLPPCKHSSDGRLGPVPERPSSQFRPSEVAMPLAASRFQIPGTPCRPSPY